MSTKETYISPIAIDLGAANTGVYFAHYKEGSNIEDIEKEGRVYKLPKDKYTLLMANRTASRHQRRGFDRRQMAKRLFKLIWTESLKLPWDSDTQQTISFLLNRRGFSFFTEEYNAEILSQFPTEIYELLPEELQTVECSNNGDYDFSSSIQEWIQQDKIKEKFCVIEYAIYLKKLYSACHEKERSGGYNEKRKSKNKLAKMPIAIFKHLIKNDVQGLEDVETGSYSYVNKDGEEKTYRYRYGNSVNLEAYINHSTNAEKILSSIPNTSNDDYAYWDFPIDDFKFDDNEKYFSKPLKSDSNIDWIRTHIHHLAFALYKAREEVESGGRYRSKYFEEIKDVLKGTHGEKYLKYLRGFCQKLQSNNFNDLDVDKLTNLIGHISNLELKPLRKYFNDKQHKSKDYWSEERLSKIFNRWILTEWRVNVKKDKRKGEGKAEDYSKLKERWHEYGEQKKEKKPETVIDFWLQTEPQYTIPPYQNNNNRRPPKCQSLLLNKHFLNEHYPNWENWLESLKKEEGVRKYLGAYEKNLKALTSGKSGKVGAKAKGKQKEEKWYFPNELADSTPRSFDQQDLNARTLQFIFDRAKASDPLHLNEIYSHVKKYRQVQSTVEEKKHAKEQIECFIKNSNLPNDLKEEEYNYAEGSFFHLLCRYYKLRQRAKGGRLFIFSEYKKHRTRGYEATGHFDSKGHLLTYCNHKPRQKRYQMFHDVAATLQTTSQKLEALLVGKDGDTRDDKLFTYLNEMRGLKACCEKAAKEQKLRRGRLKLDIKLVSSVVDEKNTKESLKKSRVSEAESLYKNYKNAQEKFLDLMKKLDASSESTPEYGRLELDIKENPGKAVFQLAQIHNTVFKDRSGFSKTCPVCSIDNAQRMILLESTDGDALAKAARLPAISTRIIDGVVMRLARIVGKAIADDKWKTIKQELGRGKHVHIPILTESNAFEFEPSRDALLGRKSSVVDQSDTYSNNKEDRIRKAGNSICPYTGEHISQDRGEIDHIIPRQSDWGVLNDEANLIFASHVGNQHKQNKQLSLKDIHPNYKTTMFGTTDAGAIREQIIDKIGDGSTEKFEFGQYRSFINLNPEQQKAFRHALFLEGEDIQKQVLRAINNRNRAFVNGTQRYFAETLASSFHKKAKEIGKEKLLSFDYFGVPTDPSQEISTYSIRKRLEKSNNNELEKYKKKQEGPLPNIQKPYSHLIDAQIVFMSVLSQHYKEGSLKVQTNWIGHDPEYGCLSYTDQRGELQDLYSSIKVGENDFIPPRELKREKAGERFFLHKTLFASNPGAWHFFKLIEVICNGVSHYYKGFLCLPTLRKCLENEDWHLAMQSSYGLLDNNKYYPYATELNKKERALPTLYVTSNEAHHFGYENNKGYGPSSLIENEQFPSGTFTVHLHQINKSKVAKFLLDNFNTSIISDDYTKEDCRVFDNLRSLWYYTKRQQIEEIKKRDDIDEMGGVLSSKEKDFCFSKLFNPSLWNEWVGLRKHLNDNLTKTEDETISPENFQSALREYFSSKHRMKHQKVRKVFSLPLKSKGQGFMLIRRNGWTEKPIYQLQSEENGDSGVGLYKKLGHPGTKIVDVLTPFYRSKNIVLLRSSNDLKKCLVPFDPLNLINEEKWYPIVIPEYLKNLISTIENQYQSKGDSNYHIVFKDDVTIDGLIELMFRGFHIDEMSIGSGKIDNEASEKHKLYKKAQSYFKDLTLEKADEKLKKDKEELEEKVKEAKGKKDKDMETKYETEKVFCSKWLEVLSSISLNRELKYKRGQALKLK